eukprot:CAMPEP_0194159282 /NCGR_PEP_ID=MMETSP0152-20130528/77740_1 /TAXON_ID=1049557 /ORGANISM="Thalassiothrix antarctica, Strain L6-D1" /LENGTH=187 /DNA_ID=CAMNT_0038868829 /DNA_START=607 /DNA_END=1170 /DNA_ORIENTATION=-
MMKFIPLLLLAVSSSTANKPGSSYYESMKELEALEEVLSNIEEELDADFTGAAAVCDPIKNLNPKVLTHPETDCCANDMCGEGELCRNFRYALKCLAAEVQPRSKPRICNDELIPGLLCGVVGPGKRELPCLQLDEVSPKIIDHVETKCSSNADCMSKCRVYNHFLDCDEGNDFIGVFSALCEPIEG